jgi:hypothetical protein
MVSTPKFKNIKTCLILFFIIFTGFLYQKIYDYEDYSPTIIIENSSFKTQTPLDLFQNSSAQGTFTANHDHLGIIGMKFDTHWNVNNYYLQFSLKEKGQSVWLYTAKYKVDQFRRDKYFPFGFPEIPNSKGKTYEIEIKSLSGHDNDYLTLSPFSDNFITKYNFTKNYLLANKKDIPSYLLNKSLSYLNHLNPASWIFIFLAPLFLYIFLGTKLGNNFIKYFQFSTKDNLPLNKNNKNIFILLASIYTLILITTSVILLEKHTELSEWLIYIISSISIFFLIIYFNYLKKSISSNTYKLALILGYFLLISQIIYCVFFINILNYNYLILLSLSLIPALIQIKSGIKAFLTTFFIELTIIYSVTAYFSLDVGNFSKITIIILILLSIFISKIWQFLSKNIFQKNKLILFIIFILTILISFFCTQKPIEYHHYSFYVGPAYEINQGKSILSDVPSQYGYLSIHFVQQILKPFGITFNNFHYLNQLLFILFFILVFFIIYRITKNNLLVLIFSVIAIFFQTQFSLDSNALAPSTGPLRFGLSLLIILFLTYFPNNLGIFISTIVSAVSIFWSIETAIYIVPAYIFCLGIFSLKNSPKFRDSLKIFGKYLLIFFTTSLVIFGLIIAKEYQYHHTFPLIKNYLQFATAYSDGFGSELIPILGNYYLAIIIMNTGLILVFDEFKKNHSKYLFILSFIAIHNIAIFSYFVSRSNQNNIVNISMFFLIELCLILKIINKKIKLQIIYTLPISLFIVIFFYVSYLNITNPKRLHYSTQNTLTQLNLYQQLKNKYQLNPNNTIIINNNNDTPIITTYGIKTYLPLNPSLMTILLPNYQQKYLLPNLSKLQIGTTIVYSNDSPELMAFLQKKLTLKNIATSSSDFFSLFTISSNPSNRDIKK